MAFGLKDTLYVMRSVKRCITCAWNAGMTPKKKHPGIAKALVLSANAWQVDRERHNSLPSGSREGAERTRCRLCSKVGRVTPPVERRLLVVAAVENEHDDTHGEEDVTEVPSQIPGPGDDELTQRSRREGVEDNPVRQQDAENVVGYTRSGQNGDVAEGSVESGQRWVNRVWSRTHPMSK